MTGEGEASGLSVEPRGALASVAWAIVGFLVVAQVRYGDAAVVLGGDPFFDPGFWAYWVAFEVVGTLLLVVLLTVVVSVTASLGLTRVSRTLLWILGQDPGGD